MGQSDAFPESLGTSHGPPLCRRCGTCCVAPDISTLGKPAGVRCTHLTRELQCAIYGERPAVCRGYRPDELCRLVEAPTLEARVNAYLALFDLVQPPKVSSPNLPPASSP